MEYYIGKILYKVRPNMIFKKTRDQLQETNIILAKLNEDDNFFVNVSQAYSHNGAQVAKFEIKRNKIDGTFVLPEFKNAEYGSNYAVAVYNVLDSLPSTEHLNQIFEFEKNFGVEDGLSDKLQEAVENYVFDPQGEIQTIEL